MANTSTITAAGRDTLSSKASAQKGTGIGGKFGHLQHAEQSRATRLSTYPPPTLYEVCD